MYVGEKKNYCRLFSIIAFRSGNWKRQNSLKQIFRNFPVNGKIHHSNLHGDLTKPTQLEKWKTFLNLPSRFQIELALTLGRMTQNQ